MVIAHSRPVSRWGSKLDYLGITTLITGSFFPTIYYGFYCFPQLQKIYWTMVESLINRTNRRFRPSGLSLPLLLLMINSLLMLGGIPFTDLFNHRPIRAGLFVAMGLSGLFPVAHLLTLLPVYPQLNCINHRLTC
jgi:adiponectin receptor